MCAPVRSSPSRASALTAAAELRRATPPPGTMPSSRAARVACSASSTRCFFSFISVSVAARTLTTATPPAGFAPLGVAGAVDARRRVLVDDHAAGAAQLRGLGVLELEAHLLGDHLGAGQDADVLEHPLAAVTEARRLHGDGGERAAQLVDDDRGERLALHV